MVVNTTRHIPPQSSHYLVKIDTTMATFIEVLSKFHQLNFVWQHYALFALFCSTLIVFYQIVVLLWYVKSPLSTIH